MKKKILFSTVALFCAVSAHGAVPWWTRPTVCSADPTPCYTSMGTGFASRVYDENGNCWGMKLICPDALLDAADGVPVPMGRAEIAAGRGINSDFDTAMLNGDCYGRRKTSANGTQVAVDGKYVNVWCKEVLDNDPTREAIPVVGGFVYNVSPTCAELASNGYIGVLNGKCYANNHYDTEEFFIECGASGLVPERIIVLNGAYNTTASDKVPADTAAADKIFDRMYSVSQSQHKKYFGE